MKYNPDKHHRHSIRIKKYDYSRTGLYFVTICLNQRIPKNFAEKTYFGFPTFGKIENDIMILNDAGKIVQQIWNEIPQQHSGVRIGEFAIMPDHIHGIIEIDNDPNHGNAIHCVKQQNDPNRRGAIYRVQSYDTERIHPCCTERIQPYYAEHTQQQNEPNDENYGDKYGDGGAINRAPTVIDCAPTATDCIPTAIHCAPAKGGTGGFAGMKNPMFHNNLGRIIRWFKGRITFECRKINCDFKWQRNYYEHIIRDEQSYKNISRYIVNNPIKWQRDKFYKQGEK
jgi:REP element-mobilizing transposase RayT